MFKLSKSTNEGPRDCGRPQKMAVTKAQDTVFKVFWARTSNSRAFKLTNTKEAFTNKLKSKAAGEAVDPDSISTGASDTLTKVMTVAASMRRGRHF